jgi:hypothetical protein
LVRIAGFQGFVAQLAPVFSILFGHGAFPPLLFGLGRWNIAVALATLALAFAAASVKLQAVR